MANQRNESILSGRSAPKTSRRSALSGLSSERSSNAGADCLLPTLTQEQLTQEQRAEQLAADFLSWHEKKFGCLPARVMARDVKQWAQEIGLSLNETQLKQLIQAGSCLLTEAERKRLLAAPAVKSENTYTNLLSAMVAAEALTAEKEKRRQEEEKSARPLFDRESVQETRRKHDEIKAATNCTPAMCDRMTAKRLELQLLTKNIPSEEVQSVEQFLAQLREELARALPQNRH
jgi:hypothetical protein